MKRRLLSLIAIAFLLACFFGGTCMAASSPLVMDEYGLLSASEVSDLEAKAQSISMGEGCDVIVVTVDSLQGKTASTFADEYFLSHGYGQGQDLDGILLLVAMGSRDWAFSTSGYAIYAFNDAGLSMLADQVVPYLSDGDYYGAFDTYLDLCKDYLDQAHAGTPYGTNNKYKAPISFGQEAKKGIGCLVVGLLAALAPMGRMKKQVKNVAAKSTASDYVRQGSLTLTGQSDMFLYRNVAVTPRPKDNNRVGGSTTHSTGGHTFGGSSGKF